LRVRLKVYKDSIDHEWVKIQTIIKTYTPKYFP
jgi:hypothetical protein